MTPEQREEIEAWRKQVDNVFVAPSVGWRALCHIDTLLSALDAEAGAVAAEERVRELEGLLSRAHDAMVTWCSSEWAEHPLAKEVAQALKAQGSGE